MAGNALDRPEARTAIENAENGVEDVCVKLQQVSENVYKLNESYTGAGAESLITKVYASYQTIIDDCMESFGGQIKHIFIDYHKGLLGLVNQGSDGDSVNVDIASHKKSLNSVVPSSPTPGIKDYAVTKSRIEELQQSVDSFVAATDNVIAAYQRLWWLGNDAGNDAIKDEAHAAAEKVRELIRDYASKFKDINTQFKMTVEQNQTEQGASQEEVEARANELYSILEGIDFNTISMDQNAAELIASSWRILYNINKRFG